jgi:hypothetical protein
MAFTRRHLRWTLPLVTLLLTALTACSSGGAVPKAGATSGGSPQAATLAVTTVKLPANSAPAGTKLTLAAGSNPLPSDARAILKSLTTPIQISLSGAQPLQPATISAHLNSAPVDPLKVYLVTQSTSSSPVQLVPATWDAGTQTLSAPMSHFSIAFFASIGNPYQGRRRHEHPPLQSSTVAGGFINSGDVADDRTAPPSASNHHQRAERTG